MSLFKRKKAGEEANTIPEAMDDITQTLLIPVKDEGEKTMCADAYETSQAEIASYTSIGTRKSQQLSLIHISAADRYRDLRFALRAAVRLRTAAGSAADTTHTAAQNCAGPARRKLQLQQHLSLIHI